MCGIIGMVGVSAVNQRIYDALTVLQHRGQDAAGIATVEGVMQMPNREFAAVKGLSAEKVEKLKAAGTRCHMLNNALMPASAA